MHIHTQQQPKKGVTLYFEMHVKENNAEFVLRILSLICCLSGDNIDSRDSKFEKKMSIFN